MRTFEIIIPILLTVYTLWPLASGSTRPQIVNGLPALTAALVIIHLFTEGYRWQMIPLYVLTGILLVVSLPGLNHPTTGDFKRLSWPASGLFLTFILLVVAAAIPALLPVPKIVAPTGPFIVGTRTFVLTDTSRKELYSGKDGPRRFMVQVWYPADPQPGDKLAPFMANADILAPAIAEYVNLPKFTLNQLGLAKATSYQDAFVNADDAPYPILVFSHGWTGYRTQSTYMMQELASQGYIVIGMEHPYGSMVTVFPDGTVAYNNPNAWPPDEPEDEHDAGLRMLVDQWAQDIGYALDQLADPATELGTTFDRFTDPERIGVFGHSTGGGAAIQFCGTDSRCKTALGLDPFMTPVSLEVLDRGLSMPYMAIFSQAWADDTGSKNFHLFNGMLAQMSGPAAVLSIDGTTHYDFIDLPATIPLAPYLHMKGPINGKRAQKIINAYALQFFNLQFFEHPAPLLVEPSPDYPEVNFIY